MILQAEALQRGAGHPRGLAAGLQMVRTAPAARCRRTAPRCPSRRMHAPPLCAAGAASQPVSTLGLCSGADAGATWLTGRDTSCGVPCVVDAAVEPQQQRHTQQREQQQQQPWEQQQLPQQPSACACMEQQQQQQQQVEQQQQEQWGGMPAPVTVAALAAIQLAAWAVQPEAAHASEALSSQLVDVFQQFLEQIQALGPWGGVLFVATVATAEMVPLLPTQPLSLASGLLFGAKKGALLMLLGVTLAGLGAFSIARGVGRPLAERIIKAEMSGHTESGGSGSGGEGADGSKGGGMGSTWAAVEAAIESGGFFRQLTAVALLRLTPVVPYSATNYLLGLTPIQLPAFLLGTVMGMSVWAVLYASLGGASRSLLAKGADLELLLADLGDRASGYSRDIAIVAVAAGAVGLVFYLATRRFNSSGAGGDSGAAAAPPQPPPEGAPNGAPPAVGPGGLDVRREREVLNHK